MKLKNFTRPLYSCYVENVLITIFRGKEWYIAYVSAAKSEIIPLQNFGVSVPKKVSGNNKFVAIQDDQGNTFFF